MKVAQLRTVLAIAEKHHRADGKAEIADGLAVFASNLLDGHDQMTVASLVKRIKNARKPNSPRKSVAARAKATRKQAKGR